MELELSLDPDDAARLTRLAVLAPLKQGRARTRGVRIVWHDDPDGYLAAHDLALAEERGVWRLERLVPGEEPWPPGALPPVFAEDRDRDALLEQALPDQLLPAAAFEGRARSLALATEHGPIALILLRGVVRTVATEHRIARVRLAGEEAAVFDLAMKLVGELNLAVPVASLAAEAIAIARGAEPPPRREGAPALPPGLSVADAFAHVVGHLTDVILYNAPAACHGQEGPEPVHQMRVAVRRLRSAIQVFSRAVRCPAVGAADGGLKALAKRLAPTRDWDVFVTETAAAAARTFGDDSRLRRLLAASERRRQACHADLQAFLEGPEFRRLGVELACLAGGRTWLASVGESEQAELASDLETFAGRVLHRRLKRLAQAGDDIAALDPPALHAIRLRAKRLRYAAEVFSPLFPAKPTRRFLQRLGALQDRLGQLNDGAVAATLMDEVGRGNAFAAGLVVGFIGAHGGRTRERIDQAWQKFHRLAPFWDR